MLSDPISHSSQSLKSKNGKIITFTVKSGKATELEAFYRSKIKTLALAEKVSVVDIQKSQGKINLSATFPLSASELPSYSDYHQDETEVFVEERSGEALEIMNEILCSMAQTRYDAMLNLGVYKAQIDMSQCSKSRDSASNAGQESQNQSSGSGMPEYKLVTVDSTRAGNKAPLIGKIWINEEPEEEDYFPMIIFIKSTITQGKSNKNPYGIFSLHFKAHPLINGKIRKNFTPMKGLLVAEKDPKTNQALLKFLETEDLGGRILYSKSHALQNSGRLQRRRDHPGF